jgi:hypothetical protein
VRAGRLIATRLMLVVKDGLRCATGRKARLVLEWVV